jgi:hypothetical protein
MGGGRNNPLPLPLVSNLTKPGRDTGMLTSEATMDAKLTTLVNGYNDDHCGLLELLRWLAKHPHTRFSRLAMSHVLNDRKVFTARALRYLIDKEVVKAHSENGIRLFSLTAEEPLLSWVLDLGRMDWSQWNLMLRQVAVESMEA